MTTDSLVLGIDVGGTKVAAGVLAWPSGEVRRRMSQATRPERGGRAVLDDLVRLSREFAMTMPVAAVGLGVCELVDRQGLVAAMRQHIWSPSLRDVPVVSAATGADAGWIGAAVRAATCIFTECKTPHFNPMPNP